MAVVDKNARRHHTTEVAAEYLKYLYAAKGQEIAARNFYRPHDEGMARKYAANFNQLKLVTIDAEIGGWAAAQKKRISPTAASLTRFTKNKVAPEATKFRAKKIPKTP